MRHCMTDPRVDWMLPMIKHLQDKKFYVSSSEFDLFWTMILKVCIYPWVFIPIPAKCLFFAFIHNNFWFVSYYANSGFKELFMALFTLITQVDYSKLSISGRSHLKNRQVLSSFFTNVYKIPTSFLIFYGTFHSTKGLKAAVISMPFFSQPSRSWTNKYFLHKTNLLQYLNPSFTCIGIQKHSQLVLSFNFFQWFFSWFWLQWIFEYFNTKNIRFNRNIILTFIFTFNVCIRFINVVHVITWSVWLLLPIDIKQLFKKILDYIQGLLLLLIILAQLSYFFSNTFNIFLQSMTIWKIMPPGIFQVFIEGNKTWSVICLTQEYTVATSYHINITPFHHFTIFWFISKFNHSTIALLHHLIIAPLNWYQPFLI